MFSVLEMHLSQITLKNSKVCKKPHQFQYLSSYQTYQSTTYLNPNPLLQPSFLYFQLQESAMLAKRVAVKVLVHSNQQNAPVDYHHHHHQILNPNATSLNFDSGTNLYGNSRQGDSSQMRQILQQQLLNQQLLYR